ncbi:flagellar hook-associated protein 2 [Balnearium lithotrophicum]|uniref:Flagellar hook-associated protein 2 n=1 Tax=Balnearium lithotrophicum TaxID=223788 RepID=A0A521DBI0_9BACT|nr:flagellar filament capping protein FliD [Balnearium lithotrophicum]SMO69033.1 flagellar hook-associated protein 2 [Balnearium lithotrophicum]
MAGEFYISNLTGDFDYQSYLDKLKSIKMIPVQQLQSQEQLVSAKIKALSDIHSKLKAFLKTVESLSSEETYNILKASVSNSDVASASVTGNPVEGTYDVEVSQLARANTYKVGTVNSITNLDSPISKNGTLTISYKRNGTEKNFSIDYGGKTLREIAEEINNSGDLKASIINVGTNDNPDYQLMITSTETGIENEITGIDDNLNPGDDSDGVFSEDSSKTYETVSAQDAEISINGIQFSNPTNTFDSAINGISITAKETGTTTLTVDRDYSKIKSLVKDLLKEYNNLHDTISKYTAKGQPLQGEYSLHTIENTIFNMITNSLGKYGILDTEGTIENTKGHLTLKEDMFDDFMKRDNAKDILMNLGSSIDSYVQSYDVNLTNEENNYRNRINDIDNRVRFMTDMINKEIESMRIRFAKLQTYLSEMKSVQMRIQSFAASLSQSKENKT